MAGHQDSRQCDRVAPAPLIICAGCAATLFGQRPDWTEEIAGWGQAAGQGGQSRGQDGQVGDMDGEA